MLGHLSREVRNKLFLMSLGPAVGILAAFGVGPGHDFLVRVCGGRILVIWLDWDSIRRDGGPLAMVLADAVT